jgi:hypothetical protein
MTCMCILGGRWLELSGIEVTANRTGMLYSVYDPDKKYTLVSTLPDDPVGQKTSDDPPVDALEVGSPSRLARTSRAPYWSVTHNTHPSTHSLPRGEVQVDVGAYNRVLKLRTSPKVGWIIQTEELQGDSMMDVARPEWEVPLMIAGAVLGLVLAAALAAMLIEKECHQTLLRVRRCLVSGDLWCF